MSGPRLSIIPAGAIFDRSLEPRDLQVIGLLGCHTDKAGWCSRSQVKMARELHCSRGTVQNALDRLCEAGWVEKKRRDTEVEQAGKHPSRSYAYRVLLDRDDYAFDSAASEAEDADPASHAEIASEGAGCQQAGTPTVPTDQHPGANACDGTGANICDGTKNVPLERPLLERERDARARDRKARFIAAFEQRWPTAAADDRQRTGYAAEALSEDEEKAALDGIGPFLDNQKRLGRKHVPAGWNYLEQRRWTLLERPKDDAPATTLHAADSPEAKALRVIHEIVRRSEAFFKIWRRADGAVSYPATMTAQLTAIAQAPSSDMWVTLTHQQAWAWEELMQSVFDERVTRLHLREGARAPWPWPPSVEGKIYDEALANEGSNR